MNPVLMQVDRSHAGLPANWETLNDDELRSVLKGLPVSELMKYEESPNGKLKRKATQALSENVNRRIRRASVNGQEQVVKELLDSDTADSESAMIAFGEAKRFKQSNVIGILLEHPKFKMTISLVIELLRTKDDNLKNWLLCEKVSKCLLTLKSDKSNFYEKYIDTILIILKDRTRPYLEYFANEDPITYQDCLSRDSNFSEFVKKVFPFHRIENSVFTPMQVRSSKGEANKVCLTIITDSRKSKECPVQVLNHIAQFMSKLERSSSLKSAIMIQNIRINLHDTFAIDVGGVKRQFVNQFTAGLRNGTIGSTNFSRQSNGGFIPQCSTCSDLYLSTEVIPPENIQLAALGKLAAYAFSTYGVRESAINKDCPLGPLFSENFYKFLLELNNREMSKSVTSFLKNLTNERCVQLFEVLADKNDPHKSNLLAKLKALMTITDPSAHKEIFDYFEAVGGFELSEGKKFEDYKREILASYAIPFIGAGFTIAQEICNILPCPVMVGNRACRVQSWEGLRLLKSEELMERIQGVIKKDRVKGNISILFDAAKFPDMDTKRIEELKKWIDEWIDAQPDDLSTLKNFLIAITGAPSVGDGIRFRVVKDLKGAFPHTCSEMDIDVDMLPDFKDPAVDAVRKESLFTLFTSYGAGIGIYEYTRS